MAVPSRCLKRRPSGKTNRRAKPPFTGARRSVVARFPRELQGFRDDPPSPGLRRGRQSIALHSQRCTQNSSSSYLLELS